MVPLFGFRPLPQPRIITKWPIRRRSKKKRSGEENDLGADWMIPIGIFVLMVLVLGLDFLGNNNLHGLDVFEWLVGVPAVAAVICWILFGAVDFVFAGGRKRQTSGSN
jgi:hypothetical protein